MALSLILTEEVRLLAMDSRRFALVVVHRADGALWARLRRLVRGALLASTMIGLAVLGLGVFLDGLYIGSLVDSTVLQMGEVNKRLELHSLKHGAPRDLEGLEVVYAGGPLPRDGWGRPFLFVPTPDGPRGSWEIISFGRDGSIGGVGLDADIRWSDQ